MGPVTKVLATCALMLGSVNAAPANDILARQSELTVELDYATYQGVWENETGLRRWNGIRYAAAPTGNLRWKAPQAPPKSAGVLPAADFGATCLMSIPSVLPPDAPGPLFPGSEDCLFLNVQAPVVSGSTKLPVMVWIHGGGYSYDSSQSVQLGEMINANGRSFIGVSIQYRLGAFGFLSSEEVKAKGTPNAGILDMKFALEWVQKNIAKFGGDPTKVTITGESAGAGAVMLLGIANSGSLGTSLFQNGIAASPYLPAQHNYNGAVPTKLYYDFAAAAGCGSSGAVLACLRSKDEAALYQANVQISTTQSYGAWAFYPVTDFSLIPSRPTVALSSGKLNGKNMLVGGNANEGPLFVPPTPIDSEADLKAWIKMQFPAFSDADVQKVLAANPISNQDPNAPKYETNGRTGKTAVEVSQVFTGNKQRAANIYAEATFLCPARWINDAYAKKGSSFAYQYSVPFAAHGEDVAPSVGPSKPFTSQTFATAFRQVWGNMVTKSNPSIPNTPFPLWTPGTSSQMVNLNITAGTPSETNWNTDAAYPVDILVEPNVQNKFEKVNAYTWEGGRGKRCDFWKSMAAKISI